ncbi:exonuclease domain-containing protein [Phycicoccus avicenniae]|uniref:exonuclease domain-containing protein n=1 Tax=Phycicoccus avicenniae TaxID=2828860 RepID=UPI003D28E339
MSWHTGPLALFDLETTGVDPHRDRIVTAAVITAGGGRPTQNREWLVNPGIDIPEGAAAIHGITTDLAQSDGTDARDGVWEIADTLLACINAGGRPVVGHNITYDLTMLFAECVRHGHDSYAEQLTRVRPVIDTFVLDKWADKFRKGSRKLVDVARHYGVELSEIDAHGAAADALAAGRVAWHIAQRYPGAQMDPLELHDFLVEEKRYQAESFGKYLVKQGKVDDVAREWPIQPFPAGWSPEQLPAERAVA